MFKTDLAVVTALLMSQAAQRNPTNSHTRQKPADYRSARKAKRKAQRAARKRNRK